MKTTKTDKEALITIAETLNTLVDALSRNLSQDALNNFKRNGPQLNHMADQLQEVRGFLNKVEE